MLGEMAPHRVDGLSLLPNQEVAGLERQAHGLLLGALHRDEAHRRSRCRLGNRLRVRRIRLLPLTKGLTYAGVISFTS